MKTKLLFSSLIILISVSSLTGCKDNNLFNDSSNDITIYGNVIDRTTGLPLYNVLIQEKNKVGGSTVTGNDGNYEFTLPLKGSSGGKYYIVASKDKYSTSEYELNMSQVDKNRRVKVDFQLTSESIFYTGVVVDSKNQPIVDAKISAKFYYSGNDYNIGTTSITTIDGSYILELPRPHKHNNLAEPAMDQWQFTITASKDGYANTEHVLNQSADDMGRIITLNFIMKTDQEQLASNSVTIFGTVTDTNGQPIANAEIVDWGDYNNDYSLYRTLSTVQTDSKGLYELISPIDYYSGGGCYHSYVCKAAGYKSVTKTLYTSDNDKGKSYNFNFVLTKN